MAMTEDGDMIITPTGDLYTVTGIDCLRQQIEARLKTDLGDYLPHPRLGNTLRNLIGKRNTRQTAEEGRLSIINCLTYGGLINPADLSVTAIPVDERNILYHIEVRNGTYVVYKADLLCNLDKGIRRM